MMDTPIITGKNKVVKVHFDYFYLVVSLFGSTKPKKINCDLGGGKNRVFKNRGVFHYS